MSDEIRIDYLKIYFGDPYPINDQIIIYQPSIQEIIDFGEDNFFSVLFMFIGNTTYRKLFLWNNGIDWCKVSDYELFCNLVRMMPVDSTSILFGDIDFTKFMLYEREDPGEPEDEKPDPDKKLSAMQKLKCKMKEFERTHTFYNEEQDIEIDASTYHEIVEVLKEMTKTAVKTEYAPNKTSRELLITEEQEKIARAERESDGKNHSTLLPLISFCINHPGFKYKSNELKEIHINEFMDSVKRLQVYESTHALIGGMYSGFVDTSKIPNSQFDFMRPIEIDK